MLENSLFSKEHHLTGADGQKGRKKSLNARSLQYQEPDSPDLGVDSKTLSLRAIEMSLNLSIRSVLSYFSIKRKERKTNSLVPNTGLVLVPTPHRRTDQGASSER